MISYILQVLLYQTLFLGIYELFLKKETFFQWNRFYLITTSVLAYVIPFIRIEYFKNYVPNSIEIPVFDIAEFYTIQKVEPTENLIQSTNYFTLENFYFIGFVLFSVLFLLKLFQIYKKIKDNKIVQKSNYKLVILKKEKSAFSFFNYIFLGKNILNTNHEHILKHELIHVNQKHSLDLLFFEIQKIVFWFNPFSYLYSYKISVLHEYIADAKTIKAQHKKSFFENLLIQTFHIEKLPFVNNYLKKSLLKKRIIMATKNTSNPILKAKYLLLLPVLTAMFVLSSSFKTTTNQTNYKKDILYTLDTIVPPVPPKPVTPPKITDEIEIKTQEIFTPTNVDQAPRYVNSKNEGKDKGMAFILETQNFGYKNFNKEIIIKAKIKGDKPLFATFIVNKEGIIENINTNQIKNKDLNKEVIRVINALPKIEPARHKGKNVAVKMMLAVPYWNTNNKEKKDHLAFFEIKEAPVYKGCETLSTDKERKKCFVSKMQKHIAENFNSKLAKNLGLAVGRKKIVTQFIIDKNGKITDIMVRAPHPKLKEETIRVIKKIPRMLPGINIDGEKVAVRYSLPIIFNVEK